MRCKMARKEHCCNIYPSRRRQYYYGLLSLLWSLKDTMVLAAASNSSKAVKNNWNSVTGNVVCPMSAGSSADTQVDGFDPVRRYTEISGIGLSPTQKAPGTGHPIMYVINDGSDDVTGDAARIGVYDSVTGKRLWTLRVPITADITASYDLEALSVGSCGQPFAITVNGAPWEADSSNNDNTCIYLADVGDNPARHFLGRKSGRKEKNPYRIIKLREPRIETLPLNQDNATIPVLSILPFDYEHPTSITKYADCEALLIDHTGWGDGSSIGDLYLVTKWNYENASFTRLYQIPTSAWINPASAYTTSGDFGVILPLYSPPVVGTYNLPENENVDIPDTMTSDVLRTSWTGADSTRDGTVIALSDYIGTRLFLRCPGATIAEALTGNSRMCNRFYHPSPGQVESTAWSADGTKLLEIPEGPKPLMGWTSLSYNDNIFMDRNEQSVCPLLEWVVREGENTFCRTKFGNIRKPDAWCHFAKYAVGVAFEYAGIELEFGRSSNASTGPTKKSMDSKLSEEEEKNGEGNNRSLASTVSVMLVVLQSFGLAGVLALDIR